MTIRKAVSADLALLSSVDEHIAESEMRNLIRLERVLVAEADGVFAGWMRWGLFWDNLPFLNMLVVQEEWQGKGLGRAMMAFWEEKMRAEGYPSVMTSTSSEETAQHFYVKLGYRAVGAFLPEGEPLELIFRKDFSCGAD